MRRALRSLLTGNRSNSVAVQMGMSAAAHDKVSRYREGPPSPDCRPQPRCDPRLQAWSAFLATADPSRPSRRFLATRGFLGLPAWRDAGGPEYLRFVPVRLRAGCSL